MGCVNSWMGMVVDWTVHPNGVKDLGMRCGTKQKWGVGRGRLRHEFFCSHAHRILYALHIEVGSQKWFINVDSKLPEKSNSFKR